MAGLTQVSPGFDGTYISADYLFRNPEVREIIGQQYNEKSLIDVTFHSGNRRVTKQPDYYRWEFGSLFKTGVASATTISGAPANSVITTLTSGSHEDSGASSPFMINDTVKLGGLHWKVVAKDVSTPSAHDLTLTLVNAVTESVPTPGDLDGLTIWKNGNAWADGDGYPGSKQRQPTKYSNSVQIIKHSYYAAKQAQAEHYKIHTNEAGEKYYYLQGVNDHITDHMFSIETTLLDQILSNTNGDASTHAEGVSKPVRTTRGLNEYVETYGADYTNAVFDYSQVERIARKMDAERAGREYEAWQSFNVTVDWDKTFRELNNGTGINYTYDAFDRNPIKGKELATRFGFHQYNFAGRTVHKKTWELLSHAETAGVEYSNTAFFMPVGSYNDAVSQEPLRARELRVMQSPNYGIHWMQDIMWDEKITQKSSTQWGMYSEVGLDMGLVNQYIKFEKV